MKPSHDKQQYTASGNEKADVEAYAMHSSPQNRYYVYSNTSCFPHLYLPNSPSRLLCPSNPFALSWLPTTFTHTTICPHT